MQQARVHTSSPPHTSLPHTIPPPRRTGARHTAGARRTGATTRPTGATARQTGSTPTPPAIPAAASTFSRKEVAELVDKTNKALKALGFASTHQVIEEFVGAATTNTASSGNPAHMALVLATKLFFPSEGSLAFGCYPCIAACERALQHITVPINSRVAALAAARLIRAMDAALRKHTSSSLSDAVHALMVRLRLSSPATGTDARRAVASHVLAVYATMYATKRVTALQFKSHVASFLKSDRADMAPFVAALVRHTATDMNVPSVVCKLCSSRAMSCVQKTAIATAVATATAAATALRHRRR